MKAPKVVIITLVREYKEVNDEQKYVETEVTCIKKIGQVYRGALRANRPLLPSGPGGVGLVAAARDLTDGKNRDFWAFSQRFLSKANKDYQTESNLLFIFA